jgi:hypothetical protein
MKVTKIPLVDRIYLVGPPGIGKTEIIYQKAKQEAESKKKFFIDLRNLTDKLFENILKYPNGYYVYYRVIATHVFPEDLGIPKIINNNGHDFIEFLPPKVLKVLSIPDVEGVLFIDELSNVQRDDQIAMLYSLLQEKEASWIFKLSPKVKLICAGNTSEWSEIVRELPKPLRNRIVIINVAPPTIDEWYEYMDNKYKDNWDKFTYAYLKIYPSDFIRNTDVNENYPTPRSWTNLATLLKQINDEEIIDELATGCLGKEVGIRFASLRKTRMKEEEINNIIAFPPKFEQLDMNKRLLLINSIASKINKTNYTEYLEFIKYLQKHREFLMLLINLTSKETKIILVKELKDIIAPLLKKLIEFDKNE